MSEEEGLDDDVIKGCYCLEIDIEGFMYPRIWICAEYIRIYDALEIYCQKSSYPNRLAPAAVITGQPGIGGSNFMHYTCRNVSGSTLFYVDVSRKEAGHIV